MESGLNGINDISNIDLKEKRVFIRVDFNVPIEDGKIIDDLRIRAALPTIRHALKEEAKIILASHRGRPEGTDKNFSLEPVANRLSELLDSEVLLIEEPGSNAPKGLIPGLRNNQVILLENIRFSPEEEKNSHDLAASLSSYTDVYINDAFGASHRAHASIVGLPALVKEKGIGFLMQREIEMLDRLLYKTEEPFMAILGGSKVSDKIGLIENLMDPIDSFFIGGAMAYTFLAAQKVAVGSSRVENSKIHIAKDFLDRIETRDKKIFLPIDHIVVKELKAGTEYRITDGAAVDEGWMAVDIGPKTRALYAKEMQKAKTLFWNGPMGVYEIPPFDEGTNAIAKTFSELSATTIVGGGDSAAACKKAGLDDKMTHISTGGGASLEYLQGAKLPGLEVLRQ